jgi:penicillin-binding protein 1A
LLQYRIERDLPRRSILETVINTPYLGKDDYGMPAGALTYFQRPLAELNTGELAFLAGMRKSWSEVLNPDLTAMRRDAILLRNTILDRMAGMGALTAEQAAAAKLEPLNLRPQN